MEKPITKVSELKEKAKEGAKPIKEKKMPKITIASVFKMVANQEFKDKKAMSQAILEKLKAFDVTKTKIGNVITLELVLRQVTAMLRDVAKGRKGWWSKFKVIEDKNKLCLIKA